VHQKEPNTGRLLKRKQAFCGSSHRWNEIRPSFELADIAENLRSNRMRYGNSSPHNEKELFGRTANLYRCSPRVTAHNSVSPVLRGQATTGHFDRCIRN